MNRRQHFNSHYLRLEYVNNLRCTPQTCGQAPSQIPRVRRRFPATTSLILAFDSRTSVADALSLLFNQDTVSLEIANINCTRMKETL